MTAEEKKFVEEYMKDKYFYAADEYKTLAKKLKMTVEQCEDIFNRIFKNSGLNDLEQMEDAPEYDASVILTGEVVQRYLTRKVKETA